MYYSISKGFITSSEIAIIYTLNPCLQKSEKFKITWLIRYICYCYPIMYILSQCPTGDFMEFLLDAGIPEVMTINVL